MTGFLQGAGAGLIVAAGFGWWAYGQGVAACEARAAAAQLRAAEAAQARAIEQSRHEAERLAAEAAASARARELGDQANADVSGVGGQCLSADRVRRLNSF